MQKLIDDIQAIFSSHWGLGAETQLDEVLSQNGWQDSQTEMSFSGYYYRIRVHPELGRFKIELESSHNQRNMRVEIRLVDSDGFTGGAIKIAPTTEQLAWIESELASIYAKINYDEYDYDPDED